MKSICVIAAAVFVGTALGSSNVSPTDPNVQYIGRFASDSSGMQFDMPGCEIRVRVTLSEATMATVSLAQQHQPSDNGGGNSRNSGFESNAFVVWIDGERQGQGGDNLTFSTMGLMDDAVHSYNLSSVALAAGTHDIRMFKATEADWNGGDPIPNYVTFAGFKFAQGDAMSVTGPPLPTRKIEFLGDSITAGYCNECASKPYAGGHGEAYGATWDHQICTTLDAQCHTAAWSGLGMVKNCCGGNTTMPPIFNRTLATVQTSSWDWSSWKADALVINLGTNDGGAAVDPKFGYVKTYIKVVMEAHAHYGPDVGIFLACGPMSETYCTPVMEVIGNVTAMGVKAYFLDQRGFLSGKYGPACCGHPSIQVDTAMAVNGSAFIKDKMGW